MAILLKFLLSLGVPHQLVKPILYAAIAALLIVGLGIAKCSYDRNLIASHEAKVRADVAEKAREADSASRKAMDDAEDKIEKEIQDAKDAAASSDDPLKSGFDSLRNR